MNRRNLFGVAAGSLTLINGLKAEDALAAATQAKTVKAGGMAHAKSGVAPRGMSGRLVRLATLDLESQQDFTRGFRRLQSQKLRAASFAAFERVLEPEGIDQSTPAQA